MSFLRCKFPALLQSTIILLKQMKTLQAAYDKDATNVKCGDKLREIGRRAMDLVDEAYLGHWEESDASSSTSSCQIESSSLTLKICVG